MEDLKVYLDVLRDNYYDSVEETINNALKEGKITEDEALELKEAY